MADDGLVMPGARASGASYEQCVYQADDAWTVSICLLHKKGDVITYVINVQTQAEKVASPTVI